MRVRSGKSTVTFCLEKIHLLYFTYFQSSSKHQGAALELSNLKVLITVHRIHISMMSFRNHILTFHLCKCAYLHIFFLIGY